MYKFIEFTKIIILILLFITSHQNFAYSQNNLDIALDELTEQIDQCMLEQHRTKIAILPFLNLFKQTPMLGTYLAEELTTNLFNTGKFEIVERNLLTKLIDELKLNQTGMIKPDSAKELGQLTGVDAIVTGTIVDLGSNIAVNCRLIETETGKIFAVAKTKIKSNENIMKLMEEINVEINEKIQTETKNEAESKEEEVLLLTAKEYIKLKKYVPAIELLKKCIEINPEYGPAYFNLGLTYYYLKDKYSANGIVNELMAIDSDLAKKLRKIISR